jgi:hypothetical protein
MYRSEDHPTQELNYQSPGRQSRWAYVGVAVIAVLVLGIGVAIVTRGSGNNPQPASAAGTATPTASAEPTASPDTDEDAAASGDHNGGASGGGANPGGNQDGDPGGGDPPAPPEPLEIGISVEVPGEGQKIGCSARGYIKVHGGEYPLEVTYLWIRMQKTVNNYLPMPMTGALTLTFDEPGEQTVHSPAFPPAASENLVQLRLVDPEQDATGVVAYPQCAD